MRESRLSISCCGPSGILLVGLLSLVYVSSAPAATASLPASAPSAPAMDTGTRDALTDIDAVGGPTSKVTPSGGAATGPALPDVQSSGRSDSGAWQWWVQRISFFWPVLLTASAIGIA